MLGILAKFATLSDFLLFKRTFSLFFWQRFLFPFFFGLSQEAAALPSLVYHRRKKLTTFKEPRKM